MNLILPPSASTLRHFSALLVLCAAFSLLFLASHAMGATILWDSSPSMVDINSATQVSTAGTLFYAGSAWGTSVTVNTVTFQTFTSGSNFIPAGPNYGGYFTPTTEYSKLIANGEFLYYQDTPTTPSVFHNLIDGHQYLLQIWVPTWNTTYPIILGGTSNGTNTGNTGASPVVNGATSPSTLTQYISGTFTASGTTQSLYQFAQPEWSGIGALQLRDVTPVPEPATVALLALGGLGLVLRGKLRPRRLAA